MGEDKKENKIEEKIEVSEKEQKIRKIALFYYSRPDIRKAMFEFSKNRECVPRYFEGFGKRPDAFQYDSDILELAKKGATSFHSSEELWQDPLEISTDLKEDEIKKLRIGFDLLIDVDSKYLDYSKLYAEILVDVLKAHGIKNIGVKFSGSKGLHLIIPWKAFPQEMSGKKTCDMFPEWPRLICQYLHAKVSERLKEGVLDIHEEDKSQSKEPQEKLLEYYCSKCHNQAEKKTIVYFKCSNCRAEMKNPLSVIERKRKIRCPNCQIEMKEESEKREEILYCNNCKLDSEKNKDNFRQRVQSKHIAADLVLVSPRHLFRMPYSLHEKSSLASIVIDPEDIKNFDPRQADPMKAIPRDFIPNSEPGEATSLLRSALEFKPIETEEEYKAKEFSNDYSTKSGKKFGEFTLTNINPEFYPQTIKKILEGMKEDGRKRALFILLSFFTSLKLDEETIKREIENWNKKNYNPLKDGYIKAQLSWYSKQKEKKLPPNFDKDYYKDIGFPPTQEELDFKNPVSYVIKKTLKSGQRKYFK